MNEATSMRGDSEMCEIERRLAELGYRMESSLAAFDGEGHALIEIASGDLVDPPDDEVLALAEAWSELAGVSE